MIHFEELLSQLCRPSSPRVERVVISLSEVFWPVPRSANRAYRYFPEYFR
jgi:hypothetical protein